MSADGPLPQWRAAEPEGTYEATAPDGIAWWLWHEAAPPPGDQFPPGYRLAPVEDPLNFSYVTDQGGLYLALDLAGMRLAGDAVRADPEGARRQLGLDG